MDVGEPSESLTTVEDGTSVKLAPRSEGIAGLGPRHSQVNEQERTT